MPVVAVNATYQYLERFSFSKEKSRFAAKLGLVLNIAGKCGKHAMANKITEQNNAVFMQTKQAQQRQSTERQKRELTDDRLLDTDLCV